MLKISMYFCTFVPLWYTFKVYAMIIISSREFRQNQRKYFEKADKGEQIIVHRGKDKAYALTPVSEDDIFLNTEMIEKLKHSIEEAKQGKVKEITNSQEISELLGL